LWNLAPFEAVVTPAGVLYRRGERSDISASRIVPGVTDHSAWAKSGHDARMVMRSTELPTIATAATRSVAAVGPSFRADSVDSVTPPVRKDSPDGEAWTQRVRALADQGDPHRAEQEAAAAIKAYPLNPELHYLGAIILVGFGRYDEATAALRRVLYLDPSLAAAHFTLATVMQRQGQIVEARRAYRSALALCTGRPKDEIVPLSDGERSDQLAAAVRAHLMLIETTEEAR
jgi:chemotaxis protein methyltransferase CheR